MNVINNANPDLTLKKIVKAHRLVSHPFFNKNTPLPRERLFSWLQQQYFMSISLAPCFAALYARAPFQIWKESAVLTKLISEEAWGTPHDGHGRLFENIYSDLGGDLKSLNQLKPLPSTVRAMNERRKLCLSEKHKLSSAVFALAYGNEYANLYIFSKLYQVLKYITDVDMSYIRSHIEEEGEHLKSLVAICKNTDMKVDITEAITLTNKVLDVRAHFFDGVINSIIDNEELNLKKAN